MIFITKIKRMIKQFRCNHNGLKIVPLRALNNRVKIFECTDCGKIIIRKYRLK